jgi:hypothetical protein
MLDRVAVDRTWVSFCHLAEAETDRSSRAQVGGAASERDPATGLTLAWHDGRSQPLTAILGQAPNGGALAIATKESWQLVDTTNQEVVDLTALGVDRRLIANDRDARSVVFHPTLPVVALIVRPKARTEVLLLDYHDQTQTFIHSASTEIYRMAWDPSGEYLMLEEIPEDTNGNHRLDWPRQQTSSPSSDCAGLVSHFVAEGPRGDRTVRTIGSRMGGPVIPAEGALLRATRDWLAMTPDRRMVLRGDTRDQELTPKACDAHAVVLHGGTKQVLAGCLDKSRLSLGLVSERGYVPLNVEMPYTEDPEPHLWNNRFFPIYSGVNSYLVDFDQSRVVTLNERDQLLAQAGSYVALRRGATIVRKNLDDSAESTLVTDIAAGTRVILSNRVAWVDPYVVGADPTFSSYRVPRAVAALSDEGCALVYATPPNPPAYPLGPLRWLCGNPNAPVSALSSADTVENRSDGSTASACSTQASMPEESSGRKSVMRGRGAVVAAR